MKPDPFVSTQGRRMLSAGMYRKLRGVVAGWEREERLKSRAAGAAFFLLVALGGIALATHAWRPAWTLPVIFYGALLWLVVLVGLTVEMFLPPDPPRRD